jgi:hypothetical protein
VAQQAAENAEREAAAARNLTDESESLRSAAGRLADIVGASV